MAKTIGHDGYYLLTAALAESTPDEVRKLPMIKIVRRDAEDLAGEMEQADLIAWL